MKTTRFLGAALAISALSVPAFGQVSVGVTIGTPPPPIRYEEAPPPPPPPPQQQMGYLWVPGYWAPVQGRYVWFSGRWMQPPDGDARWHAAQWERGDRGWRYSQGYWEHHDHHDEYRHDEDHHGNGHAYGHEKHDHDHGDHD